MKNNLNDGELELINKYTRRPFSEEEVYAFSVILCDNEIDRDFERFSESSLVKMKDLFVGVTGITDHDPKAGNQTARIFSCTLESPQGQLTSDNRQYVRLKARAYMPRGRCSDDFITMIDSGMKKEVSVGCSVRKKVCSVCGENSQQCGHVKGRYYDGVLCFATLEEPTDAYEWSFVAVPAQKAAGVIKNFHIKGDNDLDIEKRIYGGQEQTFTADEMNIIADKIRILSEKAADGETYRRRLLSDISKMAAVALPELKKDTLNFITGKMSAAQLEELCSALTKRASSVIPIAPQLSSSETARKTNINDFKSI